MSRGGQVALNLLQECGIDDPTEVPLEDIVVGRDAILRFETLSNSDGRIVFGKKRSIITINSAINFDGRKRFTIAHELGHHEMHRDSLIVHGDNEGTMSWYDDKVNQSKSGIQETEANQFASELLMPSFLFVKECSSEKFSPDLIRKISDRFQTSRTSAIYRFLEFGHHPICVFHIHDNKVRYWKKSEDFNHYIIDRINLEPPSDSVAAEYFKKSIIYGTRESKQPIWKSTWFSLNKWEDDRDFKFYEYCIITPAHNTVLSVVWEEL